MNITTASNLIAAALLAGHINAETAKRAQTAIREKTACGMPMTNHHRKSIVTLRFGIEG